MILTVWRKKSKTSHDSPGRKLSDMVPTSLTRCSFDNINEKDGIFETASLPIAYLHTHLPARQGAKAGWEERGREDEAPGGARYAKWRKRVCGVADVSSIDSRRHFLPIQMESNIQHHGARSGLGWGWGVYAMRWEKPLALNGCRLGRNGFVKDVRENVACLRCHCQQSIVGKRQNRGKDNKKKGGGLDKTHSKHNSQPLPWLHWMSMYMHIIVF